MSFLSSLKDKLTTVAKVILPKELEVKFGITKEPVFQAKVGENITPQQTVKAKEVIAKPSGNKPMPKWAAEIGAMTPLRPQIEKMNVLTKEELAKTPTPEDVAGMAVGITEPLKAVKPIAKAVIPNLTKMKAGEDVLNFIKEQAVKYAGKFDEARRGVITNTATRELADALGFTVEKLIKKTKGVAYNAETLTAARELLVSSADNVSKLAKETLTNNSDEVLVKFQTALKQHQGIQQAVSGATAEAGRALQALKIITEPGKIKTKNYEAMLDALGGREVSGEIAKRLSSIDANDFLQVNKFIQGVSKAKTLDKVYEFWVNSILSGPKTHIVNNLSNTLTRLEKIPERAISATLELRKGAGRQRYFGEVGADMKGMVAGFKTGIQKALFVLKEGIPPEATSKLEIMRPAIKGKIGAVIGLPGRMLVAADEFFKALNSQAELHAQAYRKAASQGLKGDALTKKMAQYLNKPTPSMLKAADAEAVYRTFQKELGKGGKAISNLRQNIPLVKYVIPFLRTPINILKFGAEMTPLNFIRIAAKHGSLKAGQLSEELAKPIMGSLIGTGMVLLATEGKIVGHAPTDKNERDAFYREGKTPYSIKIGDKYYSFQRLDPYASLLGTIGDFIQDFDTIKDADQNEKVKVITASLTQNLVNKTYLSGLSNLFQAINDPLRYGENYVQSFLSGFVPSALKTVAVGVDPYLRRPQNVLDAWKAKIPGLSKTVFPVRNVFGEKQKTEGNVLQRTLSPVAITTEKNDPVDIELKRIDAIIGFPAKTVGYVDLDPAHYDLYQRAIGRKTHEVLFDIFNNPEYKELNTDQQKKAVENVVSDIRTAFKNEMLFSLFVDQLDIDLPTDQQTAAEVFYALLKEPKFQEASNDKKRQLFVKNLDKYLNQ